MAPLNAPCRRVLARAAGRSAGSMRETQRGVLHSTDHGIMCTAAVYLAIGVVQVAIQPGDDGRQLGTQLLPCQPSDARKPAGRAWWWVAASSQTSCTCNEQSRWPAAQQRLPAACGHLTLPPGHQYDRPNPPKGCAAAAVHRLLVVGELHEAVHQLWLVQLGGQRAQLLHRREWARGNLRCGSAYWLVQPGGQPALLMQGN